MTRPALRGEAGFTLVEMLVTVAIVGITFVIFVGGIGTSILASRQHRRQSISQANIRNFAEAVKAAPYTADCAAAKASYESVGNASLSESFVPARGAAAAAFTNTSSHVAPSLTPAGPNTQLLAFYTLATSSSFTPPSGTTERWDVASTGPSAGARVTASLADQAWTATTATGTRTANSAAAADSIAQTVLLESASGAAGSIVRRGVAIGSTAGASGLTLAKPAGTVEGDSMLAHIAVRGGTATSVTPPAGWHLVNERDNGLSIKSLIFERTATDAAANTYTWAFGSNPEAAGGIVSYGGVGMNYSATVTSVKFWDGDSFETACPSVEEGLQLVSLKVASMDGEVVQTVDVVKREQ